MSSLRRQVAYVSTDFPLIRGSLKKNLCYGAGKVDAKRLNQVISDCGLDNLIDRKIGGLEARIAEAGSDLSQGERIRVCLARALLRNPAILILDEAEANLDARAIRVMERVIGDFAGTLLMATHRPSAIGLCDVAWSLNEGRLYVSHLTSSNYDRPIPDADRCWRPSLVNEPK
jgi:ABC-type multidrug transport system fused ATPase/permease subunit